MVLSRLGEKLSKSALSRIAAR